MIEAIKFVVERMLYKYLFEAMDISLYQRLSRDLQDFERITGIYITIDQNKNGYTFTTVDENGDEIRLVYDANRF
jgi:hypothetical protein